jgi:hypothetical protein
MWRLTWKLKLSWKQERWTRRGIIIIGYIFRIRVLFGIGPTVLKTYIRTLSILTSWTYFDLLSYLFLWLVFHFGKRGSSPSKSCQVNKGSRRAERLSEFKEDRVNPYYSYLGFIVILSKTPKENSNWRWTSSSKFSYVPHTKRIRMMMGSFSSEIRYSGGNGIFDPAGEISSSPFSSLV